MTLQIVYDRLMNANSLLVLCLSLWSTPASGEALNIDLGGGFSTPPASTYGAAAYQPGFWNPVNLVKNDLVDINGNSTPVRYASEANGGFLLDIQGATPDDKLLMDSALSVQSTRSAATFSNLQPGLYDLYIYCWAGNLLGPKDVTIRAFTGAGQVVGGVRYGEQWPGQQVLGETYDKLRVEVTPGDGQYIDIAIQAFGDFNVINGVQLVPIPAPATLTLAPAALLACRRRRR